MFQYKVIHNVSPTRATLFRDGLLDNASCNFCNDKEQTLNHLLINCASVVGFWTSFLVWWNTKTNENLIINPSHILYGWHERTKHWRILNYCLLIAKYHIFCTSLRGDDLDFQNYLPIIHEKLETLKRSQLQKKLFLNFIALGPFYSKICLLSFHYILSLLVALYSLQVILVCSCYPMKCLRDHLVVVVRAFLLVFYYFCNHFFYFVV